MTDTAGSKICLLKVLYIFIYLIVMVTLMVLNILNRDNNNADFPSANIFR